MIGARDGQKQRYLRGSGIWSWSGSGSGSGIEGEGGEVKLFVLAFALFLAGCSTCAFVVDPFGPGKSYCYAKEAQEKYCKDRGGPKKEYSITPFSFTCADGTTFKGYEKEWKLK